jgi:4,5-DOPA dioxygenase extradiol
VLVLGSGNVVHNLRAIDWNQPDAGFDWAQRFDEAARGLMRERPGDMASLVSHPDYRRAVPTDEHFLPVLYLAGLAAAAGTPADVLIDGYTYGSLSMTSYTLGANTAERQRGLGGAARLASDAPPESTNI